ncbi:MAG: hypothetical protein COU29_01325 [Candidatus Magasanikbacteria bacterium CG10_big_fil_rev_8_21_14_0_10_36_32]|uniref:Peptidase M50 domain-containing protein n=1 Tax=Candidatus Magasanikbacteria bacterium CG10_big_fil_rev_8_21_14_0_10_36_32 TaxID=1974646 RepID=A0A2M6W6J3_9BACT|nr:MAG: hypothetical protein COU29_01325 [Candidatus Magasanikbacteria bacterium CG10_big_fil_rev_8_21_14_0_10_36_32]
MATLLIFIAVLAILVLSHEVGHFIAAKKSGMKVYEFGFGFAPRLFGIQRLEGKKLETLSEEEIIDVNIKDYQVSENTEVIKETVTDKIVEITKEVPIKKWRWVWGNKPIVPENGNEQLREGTVYSINLIPLGGFVQIKGEDNNDIGPDSFSGKPAWKKAIVMVAGVAMNVLLAAILFSVGYSVGLPMLTDKIEDTSAVQNRTLEIVQVLPDKPAALVDIQSGDVVAQVGDIVNPRLFEMQNYVDAHQTDEVSFVIKRGDELLNKKIKPMIYQDSGRGGIGVGIAEYGTVKYPWYKAIYHACIDTGVYLKDIVIAFGSLIKGLFIGKEDIGDSVSGPIGIAVMTGEVAKMGFLYLLQFVAVLSLNLAVVNILPIPALDGGRLLFLLLSKINRRWTFLKYEQVAHTVGFVLLLALIALVTIKDIGTFRGLFIGLWNKFF